MVPITETLLFQVAENIIEYCRLKNSESVYII